MRQALPNKLVQGSFDISQSELPKMLAMLHAGVTVVPSCLYPCKLLNCQYQPAAASVLSFTVLGGWVAPKFLVIQHFEGSPGILVVVPYVTVFVTGATLPAV
jgi:hypothetical protein